MNKPFATCDLCDEHRTDSIGNFRVVPSVFRSFGGARRFFGAVRTVQCFGDNSLVKAALGGPGGWLYADGVVVGAAPLGAGARGARSGSRTARARVGCPAQLSVLAWRQPYVSAKRPGKRAVIGKTALRRDLRHR